MRSNKNLLLTKKIILVFFLFLVSCGGEKFVQESTGSEDVVLVTSVDQNQCEFKGEVKKNIKAYTHSRSVSEKKLI